MSINWIIFGSHLDFVANPNNLYLRKQDDHAKKILFLLNLL